MIFNYYVSQQQYSWDCDVWHNRHLDLKIRVLTHALFTSATSILLNRSLSSKTICALSPESKTKPTEEVTPASGAWSRRSAWTQGAPWRSRASRGARKRLNFGVPFCGTSPGNHQSPSSPTTSSLAEGLVVFLVSTRISSIYSCFLEPSVARDSSFTGVRRRSTWMPVMLR
jgi:hypothetical protein